MNLKEFIEKYNLGLTLERVGFRTDDLSGNEWDKEARHFHYLIFSKNNHNKSIKGYYSQGSAHTKNPTLEEILESLRLDTLGLDTFPEWCKELGYDEDSRKAYSIYEACIQEEKQLLNLLGYGGLRELHNIEI